jgi:aspartate/glutamate racemase
MNNNIMKTLGLIGGMSKTITKVGLIGTRFTMENSFFKDKLLKAF